MTVNELLCNLSDLAKSVGYKEEFFKSEVVMNFDGYKIPSKDLVEWDINKKEVVLYEKE